jgi:hypothetical protein
MVYYEGHEQKCSKSKKTLPNTAFKSSQQTTLECFQHVLAFLKEFLYALLRVLRVSFVLFV